MHKSYNRKGRNPDFSGNHKGRKGQYQFKTLVLLVFK